MERLPVPGPKAKSIVAEDSQYISNSYRRAYPFVMEHGKGTEVWDVYGNRFLDFAAGIAVTGTGHSHPDVVKAIKDQAEKFLRHGAQRDEHEKSLLPPIPFLLRGKGSSQENRWRLL